MEVLSWRNVLAADDQIRTKKPDEAKGPVYAAVFKIKTLSDAAHRFKVRKKAEQLNLTGLCIYNPQFNMVYVEGAAKFIRNYKRLMTHRIKWTEAARPRGRKDAGLDNPSDAEEGGGDEVDNVSDVKQELEDNQLADNKCDLVWEGVVPNRSFSYFKLRTCLTDREAKELLGEGLRGHWDQAKDWKGEEEKVVA
ncbi:small nuclear ribonucleoprotein hPrp3 [Mycena sanguinolenta]|nr:small nuclear ribonucleoprotein hPrp3 [Mycena sanguinolenta]